jgi:formylglycine-generating enzyme required for sulfatase activity
VKRKSFGIAVVLAIAVLLQIACKQEPDPAPEVSGVTVIPGSITLAKGSGKTFSAAVQGSNNPSQSIIWTLEGTPAGTLTTLSDTGFLSIDPDETAASLTVKAVSVSNTSKSGTSAVTVDTSSTAAVTAVRVSSAYFVVSKGGALKFTASVTGQEPIQAVQWSIVETSAGPGTAIDSGGVLTVDPEETLKSITVKAASVLDSTKAGTLQVPILGPNIISYNLNGVSIDLVLVHPTGSQGFQRNAAAGNVSIITKPYYLQNIVVTRELFREVMGELPAYDRPTVSGDSVWKRPMVYVNWYMGIAFCNKLSERLGLEPVYAVSGITGWSGIDLSQIPVVNNAAWNAVTWDETKNGFRMPTEMEYLWAAMGAQNGGASVRTSGYNKQFSGDNGRTDILDYCWFAENRNGNGNNTRQVGLKKPNELGLYDMSGNVYVYCWDSYPDTNAASAGPPNGKLTDYKGAWTSGPRRVMLKGSLFSSSAADCRLGIRLNSSMAANNAGSDGMGFRIACNPYL